MERSRVRAAVKALAVLGSVLVALTALVGFAHTRAGRPLLAAMGAVLGKGGPRCPLGYDQGATPEQKEARRARFAATHRGVERARLRPALGFTLDGTTRDDVVAWARRHALTCSPGRSAAADLSCADVPPSALPDGTVGVANTTLWFSFGPGDRLVSVLRVAEAPTAPPVESAFAATVDALEREVGATTTRSGDVDEIVRGALYQASAEVRCRDYYAVARATNVGHGFALTEEFRSLPD